MDFFRDVEGLVPLLEGYNFAWFEVYFDQVFILYIYYLHMKAY